MAVVTELNSYHTPNLVTYGLTPGTPAPELRYKRADNDTADLNNPIPVPASGSNYSWRKLTRLRFTAGLATAVSNLYWFADAAPADWAGTVSLYAMTVGSYSVTGGIADETVQISGTLNANTFTSSAPLTVWPGQLLTVSGVPGFGVTQNWVLLQIGVNSTTPAGVKTPRGCRYRYSET